MISVDGGEHPFALAFFTNANTGDCVDVTDCSSNAL